MNIDIHERFRHLIDESLIGGISADREQSLREHLESCANCRHYLSANHRVVAGLRGFSFEVDATLTAGVLSSLERPAQLARRGWAMGVAAAVLTIGGSIVDLRFGDLIASVFDLERIPVRQGLLDFWIVPSLFVLLLFPLLPLLSKAGTHRAERTQ